MTMFSRTRKLVIGGIVAAVLTGGVGGAALAQTPTPTRPTPQQRGEEFMSALAGKLGKSSAEVRAAILEVQKERVAADLAAQRINQAQADRMNQRIDAAGGLGMFGGSGAKADHGPGARAKPGAPGKPGTPGKPGAAQAAFGGELATFLGVQPADIATALRSGKSLAAFATGKGKTREQLKSFLTDQHRARVSQQVAAGRLTQTQADARLQLFVANLDKMIDRALTAGGRSGAPGKPTL